MSDAPRRGAGKTDAGTGEIRVQPGEHVEFQTPGGGSVEFTADADSGGLVFTPEPPARCAFCDRPAGEVWLLVQGPTGAHLCDACLVFCLAEIAGHGDGSLRVGAAGAAGAGAVVLPPGTWESVRRCPRCGTYTLSAQDQGPPACAHCRLSFAPAG